MGKRYAKILNKEAACLGDFYHGINIGGRHGGCSISELLITWDFNTLQSAQVTENGAKHKNHSSGPVMKTGADLVRQTASPR